MAFLTRAEEAALNRTGWHVHYASWEGLCACGRVVQVLASGSLAGHSRANGTGRCTEAAVPLATRRSLYVVDGRPWPTDLRVHGPCTSVDCKACREGADPLAPHH